MKVINVKFEFQIDDDFGCMFCPMRSLDTGCKDFIPREHCAAARRYIEDLSHIRPDWCPLEPVETVGDWLKTNT